MKRTFLPATGFPADTNILPQHPADAAAWIWHPACGLGETAFLRFMLEFDLEAPATLPLHVSADQRFQLRLDDEEVGYGPDRCDVENWSVTSYEAVLASGRHRLEALVWWLADETLANRPAHAGAGTTPSLPMKPPIAQASWRGGFLLATNPAHASRLNTGTARWQVENHTDAIRAVPKRSYTYHDIGPEFHTDGTGWSTPAHAEDAEVIAGPIAGNVFGVQRPGWRLTPATLAEQSRFAVHSGRLRVIELSWTDGPFSAAAGDVGEIRAWSSLLTGGELVTVPPRSERTVLWDFEDYVCGYAELATAGGAGARVRIDWAESLHEAKSVSDVRSETGKGRRDDIAGKVFYGFGDEYFISEGSVRYPALWWRSGRFLRVCVRTADEPLRIATLAVRSTGYPLGDAAPFSSDDAGLDEVMVLAERTLRACAHELWVDCPFYEQMAYVGDTRLAALCNYAMFADDRLSRRMIELFDQSRRDTGLVAERHPTGWRQVSTTYSLLWVLMVRDFAWWRDDEGFVRQRLRAVRSMLEEVWACTDADGLLAAVPGWPFVDWVPEWSHGCGPGVREGDSCLVNLHLLLALRAAVDLEAIVGEPELASLARRRAAQVSTGILARYWSADRNLLSDTRSPAPFSEHAQALGLLAGIEPPGGRERWTDAWIASTDLSVATIYFSFYTIEALQQTARTDAWHRRLALWRQVHARGLLTLPEAPEPTRSDCHGWSAHVRWHAVASLAGVRPLAPRFASVGVAPQFGAVHHVRAEVNHPRGWVRVELRREDDRLTGAIDLPSDTPGELRWQGRQYSLHPGANAIGAG
jgi:alpha-L-rhamnosidase